MEVLALGGCGGMGRHAVRTALRFDFVDRVIVADRDHAAACGSRAAAAGVDVTDAVALRALLTEAEIVLNTVGPFYRFGVPILEAAIDADCHYFDINDDWEPTLEMLELHGRAEAKGLTAVIGLGASPGISNMLAAKAIAALDSVEEVLTGWSLGGIGEEGDFVEPSASGPSAALVHWMHQCSGSIRLWQDGGYADVSPVEERQIDFPDAGVGRGWTVGHPEALTLPLTFPMRASANVMLGPGAVMAMLAQIRDAIDAGQLTVEEAAKTMSGPVPDDMKASMGEEVTLPPLFALAIGSSGGVPKRVGAFVQGAPDGGMGGVTGIPLALGLPLLSLGRIAKRGVFAPEAVIDPDEFFTLLAPYCKAPGSSTPFASPGEFVRVTEAG